MGITVEKIEKSNLQKRGVFTWPIWEKEVSKFDWKYDSVEECLFLEGEVTVKAKDGTSVSFGKGDFVTFPEGLECTWIVTKPVRKHYRFKG